MGFQDNTEKSDIITEQKEPDMNSKIDNLCGDLMSLFYEIRDGREQKLAENQDKIIDLIREAISKSDKELSIKIDLDQFLEDDLVPDWVDMMLTKIKSKFPPNTIEIRQSHYSISKKLAWTFDFEFNTKPC